MGDTIGSQRTKGALVGMDTSPSQYRLGPFRFCRHSLMECVLV